MLVNKPLISFIIPCYNQGFFLYEAVRSIMLSYSGPKEIIIIDDCSTDRTTSKDLYLLRQHYPFLTIVSHQTNKGLAATRNHGLKIANGDFIQFLDSDDLLFPEKIDFQLEHFSIARNFDVSVTDYCLSNELLYTYEFPKSSIGNYSLTLNDFLFKWERGLSIPIHCGLFKRSVFNELSFDEQLSAKEDWVFWCSLVKNNKIISYLNINGAVYRQHQHAMTKSKIKEMGLMWLQASLMIEKQIKPENNQFLLNSINWYRDYYAQQISNLKEETYIKTPPPNIFIYPQSKYKSSIQRKKLNEKVKISVVIPIYNHSEFLAKCINSTLNQTYKDFEIILVDDCSSESTIKPILEAVKNEPLIKIVYNEKNIGISASTNKAIEISSGEFIAFLDCDDFLHEDALLEVEKNINRNPNIDYFFSDRIDIDQFDQFIRKAVYGGYSSIHPTGNIKNDLLDGMIASHLKVIRKAKILEVGGLDSDLDGVQDYDLALKISECGEFHYINKPLYYHRIHTKSITNTRISKQYRNTNIARKKHLIRLGLTDIEDIDLLSIVKKSFLKDGTLDEAKLQCERIKLFSTKFDLSEVKKEIKRNWRCVLDTREIFDDKLLFFLREYNSFFDLIIIKDPLYLLSLLGYVGDPEILYYYPQYKNNQ